MHLVGLGTFREQTRPRDRVWDRASVQGHTGEMWGWEWKTEIGRLPLAENSLFLEGTHQDTTLLALSVLGAFIRGC